MSVAAVPVINFDSLLARCAAFKPVLTAVVHPITDDALLGAIAAEEAGLIKPLYVGPAGRIQLAALEAGVSIDPRQICDVAHSHEAAARAVALARSGQVDMLTKGSLHTDELLSAALDKDTGLRTARRFSHVFVMAVPTYPRLLLITDAAITIYPTLLDKVDIVQNAIDFAQLLGICTPKVAVLSAVETVTPAIHSTVEAAALCKMADRGQIVGGMLDGPLAFDNAVSLEAAEEKGIVSGVAGQADVLVVPDLEAGNMLAKQLTYLGNAISAGVVLGARLPIVLTSRADSPLSRKLSCALGMLMVRDHFAPNKASPCVRV